MLSIPRHTSANITNIKHMNSDLFSPKKAIIALLALVFCFIQTVNSATLELKLFLQGYYISGGTMNPLLFNSGLSMDATDVDNITVKLIDPMTFAVQETVTGTLKSDGSCIVTVSSLTGSEYYLNICHRNTLQTMSADPVMLSNITVYDFTTTASNSFGGNVIEVESGVYALYTGDVNHDCIINEMDRDIVSDDIVLFLNGYVCTDLNGDGFVEAADLLNIESNILLGVSCQFSGSFPPCPGCVEPSSVLSWPDTYAEICSGDAPLQLSGATPTGGTYSGFGVDANGVFHPMHPASLGLQVLTYTYFNPATQQNETINNSILVVNCPCIETECRDFNDNDLHGWIPDTASPNVSLSISNSGSQLGTNDYYISAFDIDGPSKVETGIDFNGRWCCGEFCYDIKLFEDADNTAVLAAQPVFYIMRGPKGFKYTANNYIRETDGWLRICAPITNCNPMPTSPNGVWTPIAGTNANDWDPVTNHLDAILFEADQFGNAGEIRGFDNVCFNSTGLEVTLDRIGCDTIQAHVISCCGPYTYSWSGGTMINDSTIINLTGGTTYTLTVGNILGESTTTSIIVDEITADAGFDQTTCQINAPLFLQGTTNVIGASIVWTALGQGSISGGQGTTDLMVSGEGCYEFTVTDPLTGCTASDIVCVILESCPAEALDFDGIDDYISLGPNSLIKPEPELTVEIWLHQSDWAAVLDKTIIGNTQGGGYSIEFDPGNMLSSWVFRNGTYGIASFNCSGLSSGWHHLAMTYDGRYNKLFVDGIMVASNDAGGVYPIVYNIDNSTIIGAEASDFDEPEQNTNCVGIYDELRIWDYARDCGELILTKNCELSGAESGLLAYYKFNQGLDAQSNPLEIKPFDSKTNSLLGDLRNFTLDGPTSNWIAPGAVSIGSSCSGTIDVAEIEIKGNGIIIQDGDVTADVSDHTDFGTVNLTNSVSQTYTIFNTGTSPLNILSLSVSGSDFTISGLTPASPILPGNSATFIITFSPLASGIKTATVHIINDDCDENDYEFAIQGTREDCFTCNSLNTTPSLVINTGYNENTNSALGIGATELNWAITQQPSWSSLTLPASGSTIYYNPFNNPNFFPFPLSQWISIDASGYAGSNLYSDLPFTFDYEFCLCEDDSVTFDLHSLADDSLAIYVNNFSNTLYYQSVTLTGQQAGQQNFLYTIFLEKGSHRLKADLRNAGGPLGIDISGTISGNHLLKHGSCKTSFLFANAGRDTTACSSSSAIALHGTTNVAGAQIIWTPLNGGLINSGQATSDPTVIGEGCYEFKVIDPITLCEYSDTVCISLSTLSVNVTPPSDVCIGEQGALILTVNGGNANYSYTITPGYTQGTITNNIPFTTPQIYAADDYTIIITDAAGCVTTTTTTVEEINCCCIGSFVQNSGFTDGLTVSGNIGSGGTVSNWSRATNSPQIIVAQGCQDNGYVRMWGNKFSAESIQQTIPAQILEGHKYKLCFCARWNDINTPPTADQFVRFLFRASNGTLLDNSPTTGAIARSVVGTSIDITNTGTWVTYELDEWIADADYTTLTISVTNDSPIDDASEVSWGEIDNICMSLSPCDDFPEVDAGTDQEICAGSCATLASPTYAGTTMSWYKMPERTLISNSNTTTVCPNISTCYMLLVTDASGCSDSDFVCISVYSVLVTATVENVLCSGQSSGRIYGQVLGGLPGFTVVIDPDPNSVNPILSENYSFDNLPAGSYIITGVDGNGCTYTETFVVSEPLPISVTLTPPTDLCFGEQGPIDITASGGTGDYSYIIQPWATPGVLSNGSSITTIATFAAGTYTFTLTDNNGCTSSSNFTITPINCCDSLNPLGKELVVNGDFRNSSASMGSSLSLSCLCSFNSYCIGTNAQSKCGLLLNIADHSNTVSGTSGPYNFLIIDGHDSAPATIWSQNLGTLTGGKTYVFSYWIHPKISQPSPKPSMSLQVRDVLNNTIYTLHSVVSSAIPNQWTQYVGTWTPSTDITSAELFLFQTNFGYSGNDYGIDDISFKGCQPDCPDSILTTSLVMSTGFDHNTNSTYGTNVSDGGWSVVHATPDITAAKPYSAWTIAKHPSWPSALGNGQWISAYNHYRDEYSNPAPDSAYEFEYCFCLCKADTVKFDFNVLADDYAEFYLAEDPGTIFGSVISWSTPSHIQYQKFLPAGQHCIRAAVRNLYSVAMGISIAGTIESDYLLKWGECDGVKPIIAGPIDINVPNDPQVGTATVTNVSCWGVNDGNISVPVYGGTPPYAYTWSNGATTPTNVGLAPGNYTLTVIDSLGSSASGTYTITEPAALTVTPNVLTNVLCYGGSEGSVELITSGGIGNITFELTYSYIDKARDACSSNSECPRGFFCKYMGAGNPGLCTKSLNFANTDDLAAGIFHVIATDSMGCTSVVDSFIITQPDSLQITATSGTIQCFGNSTAVMVTATGGTVPYIGTGSFSQFAGTATYSIIDANGCPGSVEVSLSQPSKVEGSTTATIPGCSGNDGSASVIATGGTGSYSYLWSANVGSQTTATASGLLPGNYSVIITDANGCTGSAFATVGNPTATLLQAPGPISGPSAACRNSSGIVYSVSVVPGATSYVWTLPNGATGSSTTNSITLSFSSNYNGGFISVAGVNICGPGLQVSKNIPVITTYPTQPTIIVGPAIACGPSTATYSTTANNALGFNWTVSGGITILSGQGTNTITVNLPAGFGQGSVQVYSTNCYSNSAVRGMIVTGNPILGAVSGSNYVCANSSSTYSIAVVPGATSYVWSVTGNATLGATTLTSTTSSQVINFGPSWTSGIVTVTGFNYCGSSSKSFTVFSTPTQPGSISGLGAGLCGLTNQLYSIAPVAGATNYQWTVPSGVTINSTNGLSINVNFTPAFTSAAGNICVSALNACGASPQRCYTVTSRPAIPTLTGSDAVCKSNNSVSYSATTTSIATSWNWTVTGGATITPSGSSAIVNYTSATTSSAIVRANANNNCGSGQPGQKNVAVNLGCRNGIENTEAITESAFNVYPNPTKGNVNITFNASENEKFAIKITDMLGNLVSDQQITSAIGFNSFEVNLDKIAKGVYIVSVRSENINFETQRLVVE